MRAVLPKEKYIVQKKEQAKFCRSSARSGLAYASMTTGKQVIKVLRRNLMQSLKNHRFDEAKDLLEHLKDEEPLSLETRGLELEFFITSQQWTNARPLANQLSQLFPQSARIHYLAGRVFYQAKDYLEAFRCFSESNVLHTHWRTRRWLGKTQTQRGEFVDAEAILIALQPIYTAINLDLAWLYERMNQPERALKHVETFLLYYPDQDFATQQRLRLRAMTLEPELLSKDVEALLELDEEVPPEMLPTYLQHLLASGQGQSARKFVTTYRQTFDQPTAASLAWICHRLQAYDLAMCLFLDGLPARVRDVKYLSALESAARHCNRVDELIPRYELCANEDKRFYGRIKSLRKRLSKPD